MSEALFSGDVASLKENEIIELFGEFKKPVEGEMKLEDLIINLGLATSKREARTFITGNSVSINGTKHTDPNEVINSSLALFNKYLVVKRGKKNYALGEF